MCMCTYVGIDPEADVRHLAFSFSQLVDNFQLGNTLYVKAEYILIQSEIDLPVALPNTCIDYLLGWKASLNTSLYLTTADTVGTKS